jgi:hypothetical protein
VEQRSRDNGLTYVINPAKRGKWFGYLRGLVLIKILLTISEVEFPTVEGRVETRRVSE